MAMICESYGYLVIHIELLSEALEMVHTEVGSVFGVVRVDTRALVCVC